MSKVMGEVDFDRVAGSLYGLVMGDYIGSKALGMSRDRLATISHNFHHTYSWSLGIPVSNVQGSFLSESLMFSTDYILDKSVDFESKFRTIMSDRGDEIDTETICSVALTLVKATQVGKGLSVGQIDNDLTGLLDKREMELSYILWLVISRLYLGVDDNIGLYEYLLDDITKNKLSSTTIDVVKRSPSGKIIDVDEHTTLLSVLIYYLTNPLKNIMTKQDNGDGTVDDIPKTLNTDFGAFWAVRDVVLLGGRTNINCGLVGALLGALFGMRTIPMNYIRDIDGCKPSVSNGYLNRPDRFLTNNLTETVRELLR